MDYKYIPFIIPEGITDSAKPVKGKAHLPDEFGYEYVRFGESTVQAFKHKSVQKDIKKLLEHYIQFGYGNSIPQLENFEFRREVARFRATLDCWEMIPIKKVFSKDEIYYRSLEEGPSFYEFIKKSRATTLRGLTSMLETDIEEEYFFPDDYEGYDSIIHERNLIRWDDKDDVDDVKYAFMPASNKLHNFKDIFWNFLKSVKIDPAGFELNIDTLSELKNTKMFDPVTRKTSLMREFWVDEIDLTEPYFAKRTVVLTDSGTRDTGVGDPSTIAKVKAINKLCRTILQDCRYSVSAKSHDAAARIARVLRNNGYLHLDFKKYGLSFPRVLQNTALELIGEFYQINVENLLIKDFFIDIDGETYITTRGVMLGWVDCLNELCVHSLLWDLSVRQGLRFDWVGFNDDFEISYGAPEAILHERAMMIRECVLATCSQYDILISMNKSYASRASLFLEKYFRFGEKYSLNMDKRQLSCRAYGRSLIQSQAWKAKILFASAWSIWPCEEIANRCILTSPTEFALSERTAPLVSGGWYPALEKTLDRSLDECPDDLLNLTCELVKITLPDISSKPEQVSSNEQIYLKKVKILPNANSSSEGRKKFEMEDTADDVNFLADGYLDTFLISSYALSPRHGILKERYTQCLTRIRESTEVYTDYG